MRIAVLGGTGRTGRLLVEDLLADGHRLTLLVRNPRTAPAAAAAITIVTGDVRDAAAVCRTVAGADAVASALGPVGKDTTLLRDTARLLTTVMTAEGVNRYVGISVAGLNLPGDDKRSRDKVISWLLNTFGGELARDKIAELQVWEDSSLDWTLVRVPRLVDGEPSAIEHDPHRSGRRTTLTRANLARFLADTVEEHLYSRAAPFVTDL